VSQTILSAAGHALFPFIAAMLSTLPNSYYRARLAYESASEAL
jgi:hypothetical protein